MHVELEFLHKTQFPLLRLIRAGAYFAPKGKDYPLHENAHWEIHCYRLGHITSIIADEHYEVQPGMVTIVPPETPHGEIARTAYANYFVFVEVPPNTCLPRVVFDDAHQSLLQVCAACVRECNADAPHHQMMVDALSVQLSILLYRAYQNQQCSDDERLVRSAEQFFRERFASHLRIKDVAREMGVSTSYLRMQFKRLRGETPLDCLHRIRLEQALHRLRTSDLTLDIIADMCGYDSASHLSRHIKRATGKTPGMFRPI